jgi:hypothetical protein
MGFKGFGKPKEAPITKVVEFGLRHYEYLKSCAVNDPDAQKLLAKCVMRFASLERKDEQDEETLIKYGRVATAVAVENIVDVFRSEGKAENCSLLSVLKFIDDNSIETLSSYGV